MRGVFLFSPRKTLFYLYYYSQRTVLVCAGANVPGLWGVFRGVSYFGWGGVFGLDALVMAGFFKKFLFCTLFWV